jgi:hypothetical protein
MATRSTPDRDIDAGYDEHAAVITGPEHEAAGVIVIRPESVQGAERSDGGQSSDG